MYVGVILASAVWIEEIDSIPHVCGGDPEDERLAALQTLYSPCMWG